MNIEEFYIGLQSRHYHAAITYFQVFQLFRRRVVSLKIEEVVTHGLTRGLGLVVTALPLVGVLTWLGLWIAGFPYSGLVGAVAGVFNIVPYLGLPVSLIPALIIALISGSFLASLLKIAIVFGIVAYQLVDAIRPAWTSGSIDGGGVAGLAAESLGPGVRDRCQPRLDRPRLPLRREGVRVGRRHPALVELVDQRDVGSLRVVLAHALAGRPRVVLGAPARIGDRVRVFDGPLAGLQGIFKERKGETRALLLMRMLGTESTVEVDSLLLKKAV